MICSELVEMVFRIRTVSGMFTIGYLFGNIPCT